VLVARLVAVLYTSSMFLSSGDNGDSAPPRRPPSVNPILLLEAGLQLCGKLASFSEMCAQPALARLPPYQPEPGEAEEPNPPEAEGFVETNGLQMGSTAALLTKQLARLAARALDAAEASAGAAAGQLLHAVVAPLSAAGQFLEMEVLPSH